MREGLSSSRVWSLLHEVCAGRAERRPPAEIRRQYGRDGFVQPSAVSPPAMLEIDRVLFAAAAGFESVELSPVAPLGVCSVIARTGQRWVWCLGRTREMWAWLLRLPKPEWPPKPSDR